MFQALWDFSSLLFGERRLYLGKAIYIPMLSVWKKILNHYIHVQPLRVLVLLQMLLWKFLERMSAIFVKK